MNGLGQFEPAMPAMIVGRSIDGATSLPLGLDEPFVLLGGDRLGPDGIPFAVMQDHQPMFDKWVAQTCAGLVDAGRSWFKGQPIILSGPKGAGRTHASRMLALTVGVPHVILDLTDPVVAANLAASRQVGEDMWTSPITIAMAAHRCANPVVSVLGVDRMSDDVAAGLITMIDPETGWAWYEDKLKVEMDFTEVTWILQCGNFSAVPPALRQHASPVRLVATPWIDSSFGLSVVLEVLTDLGIDPKHPAMSWHAIRRRLPRRYSPSAKVLYAEFTNAVTDILRGSSRWPVDDDLLF
jgi:hypothetical protein